MDFISADKLRKRSLSQAKMAAPKTNQNKQESEIKNNDKQYINITQHCITIHIKTTLKHCDFFATTINQTKTPGQYGIFSTQLLAFSKLHCPLYI